jgi:serine/threonine protein kinase
MSDIAPRLERSFLRSSRSRGVIGQGGHRGAVVSAVDAQGYSRRALKEYLHPRCVPSNELSFINAVIALREQLSLTAQRGDPDDTVTEDGVNYEFTLAMHLVVPDAVVVDEASQRGILMPMMSTNLHDFLVDTQPATQQLTSSPTRFASFLFTKRFEPIQSPRVITAILYQVVVAVATLQTQLKHESHSGTACTGFSHNDLHLANLLVHYDSGAIVLCDFELVQHIPPSSGHHVIADRAPPMHRHPPQGLGLASSDVWGVGLLAVDMLTGVVPFINEDVAKDDFGDGPLLLSPEDAGGCAVIDWDSNMAEHVYGCRGVQRCECPETDALYDFCRSCLTNDVESSSAQDVASLLQHSLFHQLVADARQLIGSPPTHFAPLSISGSEPMTFAKTMCLSQSYVQHFVQGVKERPPDRARTIPRSSSSSSVVLGASQGA